MPMDRGDIEQQLHAIGEGSHWWNVRELRDLPGVLRDGEQIMALARGKLGRLRRTWLIVVTDQRIIVLRSQALAGWRHLEVNAEHIERIALRVGPFRARVLIVANGTKHSLLLPRTDAYRLHTALASLASARSASPAFGNTHMVRRLFDHVLALPAVTFGPAIQPMIAAPPQRDHALEQRVQVLEEQINELQRQVDFLEDLLQKRQAMMTSSQEA